MRWQLLFLALLAAASSAAAARAPASGAGSLRHLLQSDCSNNPNAPGCKQCNPADIPGCQACRYERVDGSTRTETKCVTCMAGHQLSNDRSQCGCAPGYHRPLNTTACIACAANATSPSAASEDGFFAGYYCPGGFEAEGSGADVQRQQCASLAAMGTLIATAAREEQCVMRPGYGLRKQSSGDWVIEECDVGKFNPGKNRRPCRPCGRGLTTAGVRSSKMTDCKAPAGYYFDKNAAKECPKGTYKEGLDTTTKCMPCNKGITTAATRATSSSACTLAKKGWKFDSAGVASLCDKDTYADEDAPDRTACISCSSVASGLITLRKGATSRGQCVAPPGVGKMRTANGGISYETCAQGHYKSGYNLNECKACPTGFTTEGTGAQSFSDCFIPAGWGTTTVNGSVVAAECPANFFGPPERTYGVLNVPCQPCPENMNSQGATGSTSINVCVTNPGYGYEAASLKATRCLRGFYSAGNSRAPCAACSAGLTTLSEGAKNETECVTAAGYGTLLGMEGTVQCPAGWYNPGLTADDKMCRQCPAFSTTPEGSLGTSVDDCNLCSAGYGKANAEAGEAGGCGLCSAGFFNGGGKSDCEACPDGYTSAPGTVSPENCYPLWQRIEGFDNICTNFNVTRQGVQSEDDCRAACERDSSGCMYYMWGDFFMSSQQDPPRCLLVGEPVTASTVTIGFKVDTGVYQLFKWGRPASPNSLVSGALDTYAIGAMLSPGTEQFTVANAAGCARACDERASCLIAIHDAADNKCWLRQPTLSVEYTRTQWRAKALTYWSGQLASPDQGMLKVLAGQGQSQGQGQSPSPSPSPGRH